MTQHPIATGILLGLAVGLALVCSFGMAIMRDAFQRLHFSASVVSFSSLFILIAVFLEESQAQARLKMVLIALLLFCLNAVLTHATAKATRIRKAGHWEVRPGERIPLHGRQRNVGQKKEDGGGPSCS